jgi:hypothetical protein
MAIFMRNMMINRWINFRELANFQAIPYVSNKIFYIPSGNLT